MNVGLQVWDEAGNEVVSPGDRLTKIIGIEQVMAGSSGSLFNDGLSLGTPFSFFLPSGYTEPTTTGPSVWRVPQIHFAGNLMTWGYEGEEGLYGGTAVSGHIFYGVY